MKPEALTVNELSVLRHIGNRIRITVAMHPFPSDRHYSYAETIPYGTLVPDHIRSIVREELEAYVLDEVKVDGVPFRDWVESPERMKRA